MHLNRVVKYLGTIVLLSSGLLFRVDGAPGLTQALFFIGLAYYASTELDTDLVKFSATYSIVLAIGNFIYLNNFQFEIQKTQHFTFLTISILIILIAMLLCLRNFKFRKKLNNYKSEVDKIFVQAKLGSFKIDVKSNLVYLSDSAQQILSLKMDSIPFSDLAILLDENAVNIINQAINEIHSVKNLEIDTNNINILSRNKMWLQIVLYRSSEYFLHGVIQSLKSDQEINFAIELERKKYDNLINSLPVYLTVFSIEGEILFLSDNLLEFFGQDLEYIQQHWKSFLHPDDQTALTSNWLNALKEPKPWTFRYRLRDAKDKYHYFVSHFKPFKPLGSEELQWYASAFDNTETEHIKKKNEQLATKLQGILSAMDSGFIALNLSAEIEYLNNKAAFIFGVDDAMVSRPVESIEGLRKIDVNKIIDSLISSNLTQTVEFQHENGSYLMRAHLTPANINLYIEDITTEKKSTQQLELLRTAIDRATDMVLITDANLDFPGPTILYANEAIEKVTGYQVKEVVGQSPRFLQGEDTERSRLDAIKLQLANAKPIRTQLTNYTKSGKPYTNEVDISPIFNEDGKPSHFISIQRDISDQKEQEDLAFRAHKMDSIGLVTGGVAHDFNNLLTIILGNSEMLAEQIECETDKPNPRHIQEIIEATRQGVNLTRSLLAFSKRQPFIQESVSLEKVLRSVTPLINSALGAQYNFEVLDNAEHKFIRGDMAQLESLFLNMAINARDAMKDGGDFKISLSNVKFEQPNPMNTSLSPGEYLKIVFSDNGSGIKQENLEKIFDPFFSTKALTKGTGLGLSMIYSYVDQSGGHISVQSKLGQGTSFTVFLPCAIDITVKTIDEKAGHSEGGTDNIKSYKSKKVLICEDTDMVARVATHILKTLGFSVHLAVDAETAMQLFEKEGPFDLLFTDIILPGGMDGKELASKIKQTQPDIAIIFTSGFTQGKLDPKDYEQKNCAFLQKPYTKKDLVNCVSSIIS